MSAKRAATALLVVGSAFVGACNNPPYNSYDPPPSYALKLVAQDPRIYGTYAGSQLQLTFLLDGAHPTFTPLGFTTNWIGFAAFGKWNAISGGRWPGLWRAYSTGGCGMGTGGNYFVGQKLIEISCLILTSPILVNPSSFATTSAPGSLALQFGAGAGAPVNLYIVDPGTSTLIVGPISTTLNGSAQAWIATPTGLSAGNYKVLAESPSAPEAGGVGDFTVFTPTPPPTGTDTLQPGQRLYVAQHVYSQNGSHHLTYHSDGNLVMYGPSGPVWATMAFASPGYVEMQGDGNFVVNSPTGPYWATMTSEIGSVLRVENQGQIVMYGPNGNVIWWAP